MSLRKEQGCPLPVPPLVWSPLFPTLERGKSRLKAAPAFQGRSPRPSWCQGWKLGAPHSSWTGNREFGTSAQPGRAQVAQGDPGPELWGIPEVPPGLPGISGILLLDLPEQHKINNSHGKITPCPCLHLQCNHLDLGFYHHAHKLATVSAANWKKVNY